MQSYIHIKVNDHVFLKDPESSALGRKILTGSIDLMDEIGYDSFNFKHLAKHIESTEASVYRYFENKHKLLLYLTLWYWAWTDFQLMLAMTNLPSPTEKLVKAIQLLTAADWKDDGKSHIDLNKLHHVVVSESSKTYMTKEVDNENQNGIFLVYKNLVQRVCDVILEIQPTYEYPHMLVSTIVEGSHQQRFFAEHLPRLTDVGKHKDAVAAFYTNMALSCLSENHLKKRSK